MEELCPDQYWQQLAKEDGIGEISKDQWESALSIVIDKPQSLDKRVAGQVQIGRMVAQLAPLSRLITAIGQLATTQLASTNSPPPLVENADGNTKDAESVSDRNTVLWKQLSELIKQRQDVEKNSLAVDDSLVNHTSCVYMLQKLVTKNERRCAHFYRVVVTSPFNAIFINLTTDSVPYKVVLKPGSCVVSTGPDLQQQQKIWLESRLLTRLTCWLGESLTNESGSLKLVGLEKYCSEYSRLKDKYAAELVANWKESSDPEKSVHEDIGIAAYLSCLWGEEKKRFVDLGCGNGLLVYILTSEGHQGTGYDLRRRGIWDWFPETVDLREQSIRPCTDTSFPGVDWILGNHSDELTPWIPVFACLSGEHTNYWVLPCCPFDFTCKYQRRNATNSVFRDYLNFVTEVGSITGFSVQEDRMRIPSTKRTCLVGRPSPLEEQTYPNYEARRIAVIDMVQAKGQAFQPRARQERVRNCTKIGLDVVRAFVSAVVHSCLEIETLLVKSSGEKWNCGGELRLGEVVTKLQEKNLDLSQLKAECGGLQTLLRNNHSIFCVRKGSVKLRVPASLESSQVGQATNTKIKSKNCWFYFNHPDGCFLEDKSCSWIHSA